MSRLATHLTLATRLTHTSAPAHTRSDRRTFLFAGASALAVLSFARGADAQGAPGSNAAIALKKIPSSGEMIPAIGLGSWVTFNVGNDAKAKDQCAEVVRAFFAAGGRMIDSSPMYASSQPTIGYALQKLGFPRTLFSAEKVWIGDVARGAAQMEVSRKYWGVPRFDLMQVHNLTAWEAHLPKLFEMKRAGQLRYVGISTSHGRRHDEIEKIMRAHPIDFVQISYSPADREIENRILPLAQDRGIGIIVNRPFREGALIDRLKRERVPAWAREIDCEQWSQIVLKFVIAHPAVTCAIPATSQVAHVIENMAALRGRMPDAAMRERIAREVAALV
jgi:diketogulonate reductase-like aldo/keto reductase